MKIRQGFVSNSSSSSFCIAVDKKVHTKVVEEVHPYIAYIAKKYLNNSYGVKEVKAFGKTILSYCGVFYTEELPSLEGYQGEEYITESGEGKLVSEYEEDPNSDEDYVAFDQTILQMYADEVAKIDKNAIFTVEGN